MGKLYRTREGSVTAVDTRTQLTTVGSETAPGPLLVPAGARMIKEIIATVACDLATAADGTHFIRLEGFGLPEGPESFVIGASGVQVATGGSYANPAVRIPVEIPVTPSNEIQIFAENAGEDSGSTGIGVTLVFAT